MARPRHDAGDLATKPIGRAYARLICGIGWKRAKSFKGKNRYACMRSAKYIGTRKSQKACLEWCTAHKDMDPKKGCMKCVKAFPTNALQYKILKRFKG